VTHKESRPAANGAARATQAGGRSTLLTVAPGTDWSTAYAASLAWVRTVGRARWPRHAVNNELWAASVADWLLGGRRAVRHR